MPGEIAAINALYKSLIPYSAGTWDDSYPNGETAAGDIEAGTLYVLKEGAEILAAATLGAWDAPVSAAHGFLRPAELSRVGVSQSRHRTGLATLLLKHVTATAAEKGFDGIVLMAGRENHAARALYQKNGFIGLGDTRLYGLDFCLYRLPL